MHLFHGTSGSNTAQISLSSIRVSSQGLLGPGVYLAERDKAEGFARHAEVRGHGDIPVLLEIDVDLGRCKEICGDDVGGSWIGEGYDSIHTRYTSRSTKDEWCVRDASRCRIVGVTYLEANIHVDLTRPQQTYTASDIARIFDETILPNCHPSNRDQCERQKQSLMRGAQAGVITAEMSAILKQLQQEFATMKDGGDPPCDCCPGRPRGTPCYWKELDRKYGPS